MAKFFKTIILLISLPVFLSAQYDNPSTSSGQSIKFERISVEQGLSNVVEKSILQDHQDFMWFATEEGIICISYLLVFS